MFCPECQAEYRTGFTRCADCGVELVDTVPAGDGNSLAETKGSSEAKGNLLQLWRGDDLAVYGTLLEDLKTAGIPYWSRPIGANFKRAFPNSFLNAQNFAFGFEVAVFASDFAKAKEILEKLVDCGRDDLSSM